MTVNGQLIYRIPDCSLQRLAQQTLTYSDIGSNKTKRRCHIRPDHPRPLDSPCYRDLSTGYLNFTRRLLGLGVGRHYRLGKIKPRRSASRQLIRRLYNTLCNFTDRQLLADDSRRSYQYTMRICFNLLGCFAAHLDRVLYSQLTGACVSVSRIDNHR